MLSEPDLEIGELLFVYGDYQRVRLGIFTGYTNNRMAANVLINNQIKKCNLYNIRKVK